MKLYLITKRLVIQSHTMKNLNEIHEWFNDEDLLYYEDDQEPIFNEISLDETQKF